MNDDMVERVAIAISGGDKPTDVLEIHRHRARDAIKAMRAPTIEMQRAGFLTLDYHADCNCAQIDVWQAMIDAALRVKTAVPSPPEPTTVAKGGVPKFT